MFCFQKRPKIHQGPLNFRGSPPGFLESAQRTTGCDFAGNNHHFRASIIGATGLETEFDLTDFLDEDMEIMQLRGMLEDSYESAGWKFIYMLMEPADGESISGDITTAAELRGMHSDFESNDQVVGTQSRTASPTYEGPYVVLRDAIFEKCFFWGKVWLESFQG